MFQVTHALAALTVAAGVLAAYRWIRNRSSPLGLLVGVAILLRVGAGLALFWTSYLALPVAPSLQVGGGFWQIALDAAGYYEMAAGAVEAGTLYPLDHSVPAPLYVDALALWMHLVGISPASGMYLNLCLYLATVALLVGVYRPENDWRRDLPLLVAISAYSFTPVIVLHSTQPLKDELVIFLKVLACAGVLAMRRLATEPRMRWDFAAIGAGAAAIGVATLGLAAVRWYDPLIVIGALAATLVVFSVWRRRTSLPRYAAGAAVVLVAAWAGFWGGSGPYYDTLGPDIERLFSVPAPRSFSMSELRRVGSELGQRVIAIASTAANATAVARTGFVTSGGATNITVPLHDDALAGERRAAQLSEEQHLTAGYQVRLARLAEEKRRRHEDPSSAEAVRASTPSEPGPPSPSAVHDLRDEFRAVPITRMDQIKAAVTGLAVVFLPLSIVEAVLGVDIPGGRGLLSIVDLDTIYLDVTIVAMVTLLWKRRRLIGNRMPLVVFAAILAGATALLLGYVVTNFGTLWRLRPLATVPLWTLGLALAYRRDAGQGSAAAAPSLSQAS